MASGSLEHTDNTLPVDRIDTKILLVRGLDEMARWILSDDGACRTVNASVPGVAVAGRRWHTQGCGPKPASP